MDTLYEAARFGELDQLKLLLNSNIYNINQQDENGYTALHEAVLHNNISCVEELLRRGASVNTRNMAGYTPLHDAAGEGHWWCVAVLIEYGADINAITYLEGRTAAHEATRHGYPECLRIIVDNGADLTVEDRNGLTAMDIAITYNRNCCFDVLFGTPVHHRNEAEELSVNDIDDRYVTPL
ncbi:MAG TPA: ankyrin repeat domain-containing protein [Nitrospiraceae bacterium]|nr:ankyrin repeat domain-containing protein [Nitrospiraceae bacterium]